MIIQLCAYNMFRPQISLQTHYAIPKKNLIMHTIAWAGNTARATVQLQSAGQCKLTRWDWASKTRAGEVKQESIILSPEFGVDPEEVGITTSSSLPLLEAVTLNISMQILALATHEIWRTILKYNHLEIFISKDQLYFCCNLLKNKAKISFKDLLHISM